MEVAGQWRREWAGTAEYGKVTEGGVTRRVARAMEVLHASAPGARVRVMRAAYHATSGSGAPTSSFMLHSSRRVISSGFNILESPTFPSKPLEISSTPFESSQESNMDTENYKVTEPDDMDISEPSKWRGTTGGNSIRMPSEESSSTDNASIIDLDSRLNHKGLYRKYSYDSENSDVHSLKRNSARASPLLDAPVTLSTLKYKSLLNNSSEWNNRRKSYSFEDTSPLNEIIEQKNETLAMESSTDSGICKSSEIVNDYPEDTHNLKDFVGREKRFNISRNESTDNRQFKNKANSFYKGSKMKSYKEHDIVIEDPSENNVALQSSGKLTITVPITIEGADDDRHNRLHANDDNDRKVKKVEFCKTELHFAAESGRVNIIATDEKPPPSYDFRKRRSAFVPINDKFEKPITLFGEKSDISEKHQPDELGVGDFSEQVEFDENTAATKSILKNKIPKPKPYLLGENMAFGESQNVKQSCGSPVPLGVSLINKELETQRICHSKESVHNFSVSQDKGFTDSLRISNKGPTRNTSSNVEIKKPNNERFFSPVEPKSSTDSIRNKLNAFQMSPVPKPKTRQLRDSDLTFFGIDKASTTKNYMQQHVEQKTARPKSDFTNDTLFTNDTFESVRLIKQISSSAQNSEAESDDLPEYQNIPLKTNFAPIPIPRSRVKYKKPGEEVEVLKPIIEQQYDSSNVAHESRRSRSRKQDEFVTITSRSRSEPAKKDKNDLLNKYSRHGETDNRSKRDVDNKTKDTDDLRNTDYKIYTKGDGPLYANLNGSENRKETSFNGRTRVRDLVAIANCETNRTLNEKKKRVNKSTDKHTDSLEKRQSPSVKKISRVPRTEKLSTPEQYNTNHQIKDNHESQKAISSGNGSIKNSHKKNISPQRPKRDHKLVDKVKTVDLKESPFLKEDVPLKNVSQDSKDRSTKKSEYSKSSKSTDQNSSTHYIHSKEPRSVNRDVGEKGTNTRRTSPRRSEYVIKYDDKNGTVSSISKVRAGHSTSRQKHASKDRNKENSKEMRIKSKHFEKSALPPRTSDCERKNGK